MRTKWSILVARQAELQAQADKARAELAGLEATRFDGECHGCGLLLKTEGDFARHFTVPDARYLNLGECPDKSETL